MAHHRKQRTEHGLANIAVQRVAGLNDPIDLSPAVEAVVAGTVRGAIFGNGEWGAGVQLADQRMVELVRKRGELHRHRDRFDYGFGKHANHDRHHAGQVRVALAEVPRTV